MTHGWKSNESHNFFETKKCGVICGHTAKNNFIITVHCNAGKISDLILNKARQGKVYTMDKSRIVKYLSSREPGEPGVSSRK